MNLVKKGLNFIVWSFLLTFAAIVIAFVPAIMAATIEGDPSEAMTNTMSVLILVTQIVTLLAGVFMFVGYTFGKLGGNKRFSIAFWCQIAVLTIQVIDIILTVAGVYKTQGGTGVAIALTFIVAIAQVATTLFACTACGEAVPEMKTLSIVTLIFMAASYILTACGTVTNALTFVAGVCNIVGVILYIILVVKTRNRIKA